MDATVAEKRQRLAEMRAQVAALELELALNADAAPPVPSAPAQPPLEHVDYHSYRGNIGPQGLGWQRPADPAALSTAELQATRAYAWDVEVNSVEEIIAGCSDSLRRYGFCCVDHVVPRDQVDAIYHELGAGQQEKLAGMTKEDKQRPGPECGFLLIFSIHSLLILSTFTNIG